MRRLIDCHVHTARCGHAIGRVDDCARAAVERGLWGIAMTEHLALPNDLDPDRQLSMRPEDLEAYFVEVDLARQRYPEINIVTGVEADYLPERIAATARSLEDARGHPDGARMVLGSVHFLNDWAFDDPTRLEEWEIRSVDDAWQEYFATWCAAAKSGLFDVMAHPDLVKKFGHKPSFDPRELYAEAASSAAAAGVLIEVSTAGLRKPVGELYPSAELLARFGEAGVAATVGSDAHMPSEVGADIELAYAALATAGYSAVSFPDGEGGWRMLSL